MQAEYYGTEHQSFRSSGDIWFVHLATPDNATDKGFNKRVGKTTFVPNLGLMLLLADIAEKATMPSIMTIRYGNPIMRKTQYYWQHRFEFAGFNGTHLFGGREDIEAVCASDYDTVGLLPHGPFNILQHHGSAGSHRMHLPTLRFYDDDFQAWLLDGENSRKYMRGGRFGNILFGSANDLMKVALMWA